MQTISEKLAELRRIIGAMERVVVAFSAGIDSTLVLRVALDALGPENVVAATGVSPSLAEAELASVRQLAGVLGAPLALVNTAEMDDPRYVANAPDRCFFCKTDLYGKLTALARARGFDTVACGVNADDAVDHANGMRAASEHAVRSPLLEAGITKADVRELAKILGLPNWDKPALACLSSRIQYGTPVTIDSLKRIEQAERFLIERGFRNVRVRHHTNLARVELDPAELPRLLQEPLRSAFINHIKSIGYTYVTLDLQGFRSGSSNEINANPRPV